jgi:hypothetical protein
LAAVARRRSAGAEHIAVAHLAEALQLQRVLPGG